MGLEKARFAYPAVLKRALRAVSYQLFASPFFLSARRTTHDAPRPANGPVDLHVLPDT
jgi:hypothetical protein